MKRGFAKPGTLTTPTHIPTLQGSAGDATMATIKNGKFDEGDLEICEPAEVEVCCGTGHYANP